MLAMGQWANCRGYDIDATTWGGTIAIMSIASDVETAPTVAIPYHENPLEHPNAAKDIQIVGIQYRQTTLLEEVCVKYTDKRTILAASIRAIHSISSCFTLVPQSYATSLLW